MLLFLFNLKFKIIIFIDYIKLKIKKFILVNSLIKNNKFLFTK